MISTEYLYGNYLDVLADACVSPPSNADMQAIVTLAKNALCAGSHIDVFHSGCFWEAVIVRVCSGRFRYRFLHLGTCFEGGWVSVGDFMLRWRFPVRSDDDFWKIELLVKSFADSQSGEQL